MFSLDCNSAFNGKSKGNEHLFRITKIAKFLALETGADILFTQAGALLHDADVLEKAGILGIIRHTWKLVALGKIKVEKIDDRVAKIISDHIRWCAEQLKTSPAKRIKNI